MKDSGFKEFVATIIAGIICMPFLMILGIADIIEKIKGDE